MSSDQNRAYLAIYDCELPLADISAKLGLTPTRSWSKGDVHYERGTFVRRRSESAWILDSPLAPAVHLDNHIIALIESVESRATIFQWLAQRSEPLIKGIAHYTDHTPGIYLSPSLVSRAASLGLGFDFDLYFTETRG